MSTATLPATATGTADVATVDTPLGPFTTIVAADGAVLASGWTAAPEDLRTLIHPGLRPSHLRARSELGAVTDAVTAYHRGDTAAIDPVPVRQRSGEFLQHAWEAGQPITYTAFAARSGRPAATRAAASACARNAAALFVPCHRIVRTDGTLGGFRWGLGIKRRLLDLEASSEPSGESARSGDGGMQPGTVAAAHHVQAAGYALTHLVDVTDQPHHPAAVAEFVENTHHRVEGVGVQAAEAFVDEQGVEDDPTRFGRDGIGQTQRERQ
jgi:methylated-DNA-[protein]-cysteine S-methyltransferase